uniref:Chitin-binding type-2 domain-containing protein n=1 Tax=Trichogramma kaykai TaxID=54128 RepID=A0ABD2WTM1_9HYME
MKKLDSTFLSSKFAFVQLNSRIHLLRVEQRRLEGENAVFSMKFARTSGAHVYFVGSEFKVVQTGRPGTDYPVLGKVPYTEFYCDEQAYPGFFADVETRCQAWHYCDIDGRQATFLCPNGTQFSQAVFVCDWWFNVRCELSPKLYAINSRLYQRPTESPTRPHRIITKELVENIFVKRK